MGKRIQFFLFIALALGLAGCSVAAPIGPAAQTPAAEVQHTPAGEVVPGTGALTPEVCTSPAALTPPAMAGPYYSAGSPERTSLVEDLPGTRLVLTGYVLDTDCQPVPGAWIDFWQADSQGVYDNTGYTLRGHQYTGADGRYQLETIVPGQYPGRTEHLHVKVRAPGGTELTTQLYFPDAAQNPSDRLFDQNLLIEIAAEEAGEIQARFDFVVER
jgi:protocatechuate 3,4-dioxygenase beta subunit